MARKQRSQTKCPKFTLVEKTSSRDTLDRVAHVVELLKELDLGRFDTQRPCWTLLDPLHCGGYGQAC